MIAVALTLGLTGSLHCIGMCGPIAMPLAAAAGNKFSRKLSFILQYNAGKTFSYAMLGLVFGSAGQLFEISGLQSFLSIAAGIFLVILGVNSLDLERFMQRFGVINRLYQKINLIMANTIKAEYLQYPAIVGLVNGILPCGLVYLALAGALTSGSAIQGMIFMSIFGLATLPALGILMLGTNWITHNYKTRINRVFPLLHMIFGIILILRGIGGNCHM